jgi:Spy/CpxP family protein refolding chaperone
MQRPKSLALALAAASLLAYTSTALAQTGSPTPPTVAADSGRRTFDPVGRLLTQRDSLKLTDDQAKRLEAIRAKYLAKHQGQVEELRRDRAKRDAFRASMDSTRTEVMAVLTPEQQKQVSEMRKKMWKDHRDRHRHGEGHGRHDGKDDHHEDDDDSN